MVTKIAEQLEHFKNRAHNELRHLHASRADLWDEIRYTHGTTTKAPAVLLR